MGNSSPKVAQKVVVSRVPDDERAIGVYWDGSVITDHFNIYIYGDKYQKMSSVPVPKTMLDVYKKYVDTIEAGCAAGLYPVYPRKTCDVFHHMENGEPVLADNIPKRLVGIVLDVAAAVCENLDGPVRSSVDDIVRCVNERQQHRAYFASDDADLVGMEADCARRYLQYAAIKKW